MPSQFTPHDGFSLFRAFNPLEQEGLEWDKKWLRAPNDTGKTIKSLRYVIKASGGGESSTDDTTMAAAETFYGNLWEGSPTQYHAPATPKSSSTKNRVTLGVLVRLIVKQLIVLTVGGSLNGYEILQSEAEGADGQDSDDIHCHLEYKNGSLTQQHKKVLKRLYPWKVAAGDHEFFLVPKTDEQALDFRGFIDFYKAIAPVYNDDYDSEDTAAVREQAFAWLQACDHVGDHLEKLFSKRVLPKEQDPDKAQALLSKVKVLTKDVTKRIDKLEDVHVTIELMTILLLTAYKLDPDTLPDVMEATVALDFKIKKLFVPIKPSTDDAIKKTFREKIYDFFSDVLRTLYDRTLGNIYHLPTADDKRVATCEENLKKLAKSQHYLNQIRDHLLDDLCEEKKGSLLVDESDEEGSVLVDSSGKGKDKIEAASTINSKRTAEEQNKAFKKRFDRMTNDIYSCETFLSKSIDVLRGQDDDRVTTRYNILYQMREGLLKRREAYLTHAALTGGQAAREYYGLLTLTMVLRENRIPYLAQQTGADEGSIDTRDEPLFTKETCKSCFDELNETLKQYGLACVRQAGDNAHLLQQTSYDEQKSKLRSDVLLTPGYEQFETLWAVTFKGYTQAVACVYDDDPEVKKYALSLAKLAGMTLLLSVKAAQTTKDRAKIVLAMRMCSQWLDGYDHAELMTNPFVSALQDQMFADQLFPHKLILNELRGSLLADEPGDILSDTPDKFVDMVLFSRKVGKSNFEAREKVLREKEASIAETITQSFWTYIRMPGRKFIQRKKLAEWAHASNILKEHLQQQENYYMGQEALLLVACCLGSKKAVREFVTLYRQHDPSVEVKRIWSLLSHEERDFKTVVEQSSEIKNRFEDVLPAVDMTEAYFGDTFNHVERFVAKSLQVSTRQRVLTPEFIRAARWHWFDEPESARNMLFWSDGSRISLDAIDGFSIQGLECLEKILNKPRSSWLVRNLKAIAEVYLEEFGVSLKESKREKVHKVLLKLKRDIIRGKPYIHHRICSAINLLKKYDLYSDEVRDYLAPLEYQARAVRLWSIPIVPLEPGDMPRDIPTVNHGLAAKQAFIYEVLDYVGQAQTRLRSESTYIKASIKHAMLTNEEVYLPSFSWRLYFWLQHLFLPIESWLNPHLNQDCINRLDRQAQTVLSLSELKKTLDNWHDNPGINPFTEIQKHLESYDETVSHDVHDLIAKWNYIGACEHAAEDAENHQVIEEWIAKKGKYYRAMLEPESKLVQVLADCMQPEQVFITTYRTEEEVYYKAACFAEATPTLLRHDRRLIVLNLDENLLDVNGGSQVLVSVVRIDEDGTFYFEHLPVSPADYRMLKLTAEGSSDIDDVAPHTPQTVTTHSATEAEPPAYSLGARCTWFNLENHHGGVNPHSMMPYSHARYRGPATFIHTLGEREQNLNEHVQEWREVLGSQGGRLYIVSPQDSNSARRVYFTDGHTPLRRLNVSDDIAKFYFVQSSAHEVADLLGVERGTPSRREMRKLSESAVIKTTVKGDEPCPSEVKEKRPKLRIIPADDAVSEDTPNERTYGVIEVESTRSSSDAESEEPLHTSSSTAYSSEDESHQREEGSSEQASCSTSTTSDDSTSASTVTKKRSRFGTIAEERTERSKYVFGDSSDVNRFYSQASGGQVRTSTDDGSKSVPGSEGPARS